MWPFFVYHPVAASTGGITGRFYPAQLGGEEAARRAAAAHVAAHGGIMVRAATAAAARAEGARRWTEAQLAWAA